MKKTTIVIGVVADDFTGASDAASFLRKGGLNTVLYTGLPADKGADIPNGTQAVVVALKSRTDHVDRAVKNTLDVTDWFEKMGIEHIYIKYCSTFDSTPQGNIGPVCDAVMEKYKIPYTLLCPSLPINGRTVRDGILYVNGIPLGQSSMRMHPLTPMWDSYIPELMKEQSKYTCHLLQKEESERWREIADNITTDKEHFYLVPDYETNEDAETIVNIFGNLKLLTGGSGILEKLAIYLKKENFSETEENLPETPGKTVIVSGSCSVTTQAQVKKYLDMNGKGIEVWPEKIISGDQSAESIISQINSINEDKILIYSSGSVGAPIAENNEKAASVMEDTLAEIAQKLSCQNYTHIICAGGETSGAVTKKLGYKAYKIGKSVAPGVPVLIPLEDERVRLVLKSGNFGKEDFFISAIKITGGIF